MMRICLLHCLMVLLIGMIGITMPDQASAAPSDPDKTLPTVPDVAKAAFDARATRCRTPSCKAIIVIDELMNIAQYEIGDANGVASLYLGRRPEIAGRRLDHMLLDHPALFGPVCMTATKLISRVRPDAGTIFVPVTLLVNSVDMDLRDHGHCANILVMALPRDPENDQIRMNARDICVGGDENQRRPKAACAALMQGVDERAAVARGLEP